MGELGQLLRETRKEKGLTLQEVEEQTRIRAKFIRALEDEKYDDLPTPGHVSGFLRNYALFLGLDVDEVRALYAQESSNRGLFDPGIFHPKDIDLAPRRPLFKASLVLGLTIAAVVLVVGGWAFWRYGLPNVQPLLRLLTPPAAASPTLAGGTLTAIQSTDGPPDLTPTATEVSSTRPNLARLAATRQQATSAAASPTATPLPPTATPTPTQAAPTATRTRPALLPTSTPSPTRTSTPAPTRAEGVVLEIKVIERSWMQATVDDTEQPGELLEAGEERTWKGQYAIYFICGNAGGVEATVNGQALGVLGERAEVVEKTWTPEGEGTPTPAATATRASSP